MKPRWPQNRFAYVFLGVLLLLTFLIVACGDDETPTAAATASPTQAAPAAATTAAPTSAVPTAAATAAPAPAAPTAAATAAPTAAPTQAPRVTAAAPTSTPTPTPTATMAPQVPVAPRLIVAMTPPAQQTPSPVKASRASAAPLKPMLGFLIKEDPERLDIHHDWLATEWTFDTKAWTFKLQEGVPFYRNRQPSEYMFTANDVVATYESGIADDSQAIGGFFWKRWVGPVENFVVVNDHELIMNMDAPDVAIPIWLLDGVGFHIISGDHWRAVGDDGYKDDPIGTGSFTFKEHEVNSHYLYEAVEDHWRKTPEMDELEFRLVKEDATRVAMLLTGEAHIIDLPWSLVSQIEQAGFKKVLATRPGWYLMGVIGGQFYTTPDGEDLSDPDNPLTDVRVRRALALSIDKDQINDTFFAGEGQVQVAHLMYNTEPSVPPGLQPYPYDPEEAKRLLADAGYPNGFDLELPYYILAGLPNIGEIVEAIASYYRAIGINTETKLYEGSVLRELGREREIKQAIRFLNNGLVSYQIAYPINLRLSERSNHWFDHPYVAEFIDTFDTTLEEDTRVRIAREFAQWMQDNVITVPVVFIFPVLGVDPGVVEEYRGNMINLGPTMDHEYTKMVKR